MHQKVDKEASGDLSCTSKEFSNLRKCIDIERVTHSKHNSIYDITTPPKRNKLTINNIIPGCYVCVEEYLRPGMQSHGGTGYVTECIFDNALRTFTVTYDKYSSSGEFVESNITYRRLIYMECPILVCRIRCENADHPQKIQNRTYPQLEIIHLLVHCQFIPFFPWFMKR